MTVYKQYNQEQLNDQYNVRLQVPEYAEYFKRWENQSSLAEQAFKNFQNIFYGAYPEECLDIFPTEKPGAKTLVFIHGGYWHLLDKRLFHFLAPAFLKENINLVLINYRLAPAASMDMIVSSCQKAIHWVHDNIIHYNGDPTQLYVLGHSAGGHLASMLLVDERASFLQGAIAVSGLFRLEPVMLSYLNEVLHMDGETASRNSPVLQQPSFHCPFLLVTGENETDEFIEQSADLYNCWKKKSTRIKLLQLNKANHYSIVEAITGKDSILMSAIKKLLFDLPTE